MTDFDFCPHCQQLIEASNEEHVCFRYENEDRETDDEN